MPPSTNPPHTSPHPTNPPHKPLFLLALLTAPLLALLPPRKLDLYTFALAGVAVVSGGQVFGSRFRVGAGAGGGEGDGGGYKEGDTDTDSNGHSKQGVKGVIRKLWMGDEGPGWQRRRMEREREELGRGRGYGDIIMGQVWEVFPGFGGGAGREGEGEEHERGDEE